MTLNILTDPSIMIAFNYNLKCEGLFFADIKLIQLMLNILVFKVCTPTWAAVDEFDRISIIV